MGGLSPARKNGVLLIFLCFLCSGLIRLWDTGVAIAQELSESSEVEMADEKTPMPSCPPQLEPEPLLLAIRERQAQLDQFELRLSNREQLLKVAKIRLDDQLVALEAAEEQLSATMTLAETAAEDDILRLTAVYENMKPKDAAKIFETMDVNFAAGFLSRMRSDAAAGVMSSLKSETAYSISVVMAGQNVGAPTE